MAMNELAKNGNIIEMEQLLSKDNRQRDLERGDNEGYRPLHVAVQNGRRDMAKWLLEQGVNQRAPTNASRTPLHIAAATNNMWFIDSFDNQEEIKLALEARDMYEYTPLHYAVRAGNQESVERLFMEGADFEAKDKFGRTALLYAVYRGDFGIVEFLLENEADFYTRDMQNNSVLHTVKDWLIYDVLTAYYPDFWHKDNPQKNCGGQTPLHLAAERGDFCMVQDMCEMGANAAQEDNNGYTPSEYASQEKETDGCEGRHKETIDCLEDYVELYC
jgi:ankyrin repeat protein